MAKELIKNREKQPGPKDPAKPNDKNVKLKVVKTQNKNKGCCK